MIVLIGIILLLAWLFDYAVHLTPGSLIDLLLLFAAISFGLDFFRSRSIWDRRPSWDHRPQTARRRRLALVSRRIRQRFRSSRAVSPSRAKVERELKGAARERA
jgi:hypothetical protein